MRLGISAVILERHSREHVTSRIRAGVLEAGTVRQLHDAGVAQRLEKEGLEHSGVCLSDGRSAFRVNFRKLAGKPVTVYGQTEITRDLYDALDNDGADIRHRCPVVEINNTDTTRPNLRYLANGRQHVINCDFVVACDGYHGVGRKFLPEHRKRDFEHCFPYGWLGILSETPPIHGELIYSRSKHGFALASMRSDQLSRYYIQVAAYEKPENWSDEDFWTEFRRRLPPADAERLQTGPSIEKSVAVLRAFVCRTLRHGRLFLCGDAGHIVPPTGAKGLNLAASDVHYAYNALSDYYLNGNTDAIEAYSGLALGRVWLAMRFSWWMTNMLHPEPEQSSFANQLQEAEFDQLRKLRSMQKVFARNYTGLPY